MEGILLPIIAFTAVLILVFTIGKVVTSLADVEKRKLKERLTADGQIPGTAAQARVITLNAEAEGLSGKLVRFSFFERIDKMLTHAYPEMTVSRFVAIAAAISMVTFLIVIVVAQSLIVAGIAGAIALYLPCVWLGMKRNKRQKMLAEQLPEALDFLGRILKAGHSLSTGLQMMGQELPEPLAAEFRRAYDQHTLGASIENCLKDVALRIESTDFAFFVTAVLIQRQTGGDLSEVLGNISGMIRQRIRLQQNVKAKTAEGRFTGYILSAFPGVMFVIAYTLNPDYAGVLIRTNTGLMLLGIAFGLTLMGLYCIKKITTVVV